MRHHRTLLCAGLTIAVATAGCAQASSQGASPPASRAGSEDTPMFSTPVPITGFGWAKADVERPADAFAQPSGQPTGPSGPGTAGHPGHFPGQSIVEDVTTRSDPLVAVGYVGLSGKWTALAWTSPDGRRWKTSTIDDSPASFAVAVTARAGTIVAVGRSDDQPVAWTSTDGRSWQRSIAPRLGDDSERMTAVIAGVDGFIAGGSAGPELGDRHARFWRSTDGRAWQTVDDTRDFDGAEVAAIARSGSGYVAIGRLGTGQRSTGSVAWLSTDGTSWRREADPVLAEGLAVELTDRPGGGLVAVGSDLDEREAVAWLTADGRVWERAPTEGSRLHSGEKIRMTDAATENGLLYAVGNYVGVQYGTATSWRSGDGLHWEMSPDQATLNQGEMLSIGAWPSGFVATGSFGAPDDYVPTIWISPPPG